jgi:hypothetical protein
MDVTSDPLQHVTCALRIRAASISSMTRQKFLQAHAEGNRLIMSAQKSKYTVRCEAYQ